MQIRTQQELEGAYAALRGDLRGLRGKIDTRLGQAFFQPVEGFASAEEKNLREMRRALNDALAILDRYEDRKAYHEEFEQCTIRLASLAGVM